MDNKSIKNWIILVVGFVVIGTIAFLFSNNINYYIVASSQSSMKPLARMYLKTFYRINKDTRINGQTPIQYAIMSAGKLNEQKKQNLNPTIDYFISKGVDINENSSYGLTAIHYAIVNEDPIAIAFLIEKKADVNKPYHVESDPDEIDNEKSEGQTPLKYLHERVAQKKFKDKAKIDLIEAQLKAAGAREK